MDYSTYFLSKKEMMVCIGKGILAGMLAAWILYQSVYGMVTVFIFIPLCIKREKKKRREPPLLDKTRIKKKYSVFYCQPVSYRLMAWNT